VINSFEDLPERLRSKIKVGAGCWEWQASKTIKGYGRIRWNSRSTRAHRIIFSLMVSEIGSAKLVCHTCDNPGCVNPDHLYLGTAKNNTDDMMRRGRCYSSNKTHCPAGHAYNEENTYRDSGRRRCRKCIKRQSTERRKNKKEDRKIL